MRDAIIRSLTRALSIFEGMVQQFLPRLLAMAIIVVIGWIVAWIFKVILRRLLLFVRFNNLFETAGFTQLLTEAALPPPSELLSRLVFWVVWVGFMLVGVSALGIIALQEEISRFFLFLPQIFVALLIFSVGLLAANFFGRATLLAAVNANSPSPRLLSGVVRFLIIILAGPMALERVGLGHGVVLVAFSIAFGAVMMGLAIAFGLGGRDVARRILERRFPEERREEQDEEISHL